MPVSKKYQVCQTERGGGGGGGGRSPLGPPPRPAYENCLVMVLNGGFKIFSSFLFRLVSMYYTQKTLGNLEPEHKKHCEKAKTAGVNHKLGRVNISVRHNTRNRKLQVIIVSGKDFPPRDYSGSLDTCVTLCLLPDREHRKQTAIHRRSVNPLYNEHFEFNLYDDDVYSRSLQLTVFYYDQYSHSHVLGMVQVPLIEYDLSGETSIWCHLHEVSVRIIAVVLGFLFTKS